MGEVLRAERWGHISPCNLQQPAALVFNPKAGHKLGLDTNSGDAQDAQAALRAEGIAFDPWPTEHAGHATELARQAVTEGRQLVIAAGGDGTVNEVAHALANTDTVLGLMPLGSIMNVARTLWVPRDLAAAARTLAEGTVLAMDMGRMGHRFFLEAAGVGLDAGLFGYFERLEKGGDPVTVLKAGLRFLRQLGNPSITLEHDGSRLRTRAPMVSVANGPYVGAAYAIAPNARIDDGALDVVVFRHTTILRVLLHLVLIAGGRPLPPPARARTLRVQSVRVSQRRGRPLPVHLDGVPVGVTPARFEVAPAALRVVVGPPQATGVRAWDV
ncbi:MAG: diacylglycerol/lipid kinase family protein, partial [Chloroflexota bacterium]